MIGTNTIKMNPATAQAAVEFYLNNHELIQPIKVTGITMDFDGSFMVKVEADASPNEQVAEAAAGLLNKTFGPG